MTDADGDISVVRLGAILELSPARIHQLARSGHVPAPVRGRISLAGGVQGYIRFLRDEDRRSSKSASASRVQDARAREIELRTAREESRLMETDEALEVVSEIIGVIKAEIGSMPAKVARTDFALRQRLEAEFDTVLERLSERFADLAASRSPAA